jgi:hypothetical protein
MTTRPAHVARTHAAPIPAAIPAASRPPRPPQQTLSISTRDGGTAGASAGVEHSFPLTAATLDRLRASDVAAPPGRMPPRRRHRPGRAGNRAIGADR